MDNTRQYVVENSSITQLSLFVFIMISMWLAEKLYFGQSARLKWRHSSANGLYILSALPIQVIAMIPCLALAQWTERAQWGLVNLLPNPTAPLVRFGLMFVVLDLLDYVYHQCMHRLPLLWRFHLVHHTDPVVDVSTTVREHPGETLIRVLFLSGWVMLCGASVEVLILRQAMQTIVNILSHTTFRLPPRPARIVGAVFVTPNLHHAHHHFKRPATNCNFGDVFSVWDRLFGTLLHLPSELTVFGLDTHQGEQLRYVAFFSILRRIASRASHGLRQVATLVASREGIVFLALLTALAPSSAAAEEMLRYKVVHAIYGEIGTYTNAIMRDGDTVTVKNKVHLVVKVLGIVLHREDADRTERWQARELTSFDGVTTVNGAIIAVTGRQSGDGFLVSTTEGTVTAPRSVQPTNPWSAQFLETDVMMRSDTGQVEHARIGPEARETLTIDGRMFQTHRYDIDADPAYVVWLDRDDRPVKFLTKDPSGDVVFTLDIGPS